MLKKKKLLRQNLDFVPPHMRPSLYQAQSSGHTHFQWNYLKPDWLRPNWGASVSEWTSGLVSLPWCSCWDFSAYVLSVSRLRTRYHHHHHHHHQVRALMDHRHRKRTVSGEWTPSETALRPSVVTSTPCWSSWADVTECVSTAVDTVSDSIC